MTIRNTNLGLSLCNRYFDTKFHVIKQKCKISLDGLIKNGIFSFENAIYSLLKLSHLQLKSDATNPNALFLQPYKETMIAVNTSNNFIQNEDYPETQVTEEVFIEKAFLKVSTNKKTNATILNINGHITKTIHKILEFFPGLLANLFNTINKRL